MKVILLADIKGLGRKFDVKDVSSGHARNFLLPRKLVEIATTAAIAQLEKEKAILKAKHEELVSKLKEEAEKINGAVLEFKLMTGERGEVFGSVTARDIEGELKEKRLAQGRAILEKPIKSVGEHEVEIDLGEGVRTRVRVLITSF